LCGPCYQSPPARSHCLSLPSGIKFLTKEKPYDGYSGASYEAIDKGIKKFIPGFPTRKFIRRVLVIHGFSKEEYEAVIRDRLSQTPFKTCLLEDCGIMMRVRVGKELDSSWLVVGGSMIKKAILSFCIS